MIKPALSIALTAGLLSLPSGLQAAESTWVYPGPDGRLLYHTQPNGDRIVDYSAVGYRHGREPLPTIPTVVTVVTVGPGPGDDAARIQAAIDQVAALPLGPDGYRGAVQLAAGEFEIANSVWITSSGIVLRGSGQSATNGTVLRATGTLSRDIIMVQGGGSWNDVNGSERVVLDKYVPVGATSFRVADAASFSPGDRVIVHRPSTQNWIEALGMDQIPPRPDGGEIVQWEAGNYDRRHDRIVTRVEGDRVFFDAPLTQSLDAQYGGGTVYKYTWSGRLSNVGIENLRGISDYDTNDPEDEDHARSLIYMDRVEHGFIRDITAEHFWYSLIEADTRAKNITVDGATNLDPISRVTGGRRYAFQNNSQLSLFRNMYSENGRHDFIRNSPNTGPNVFLDGVAVNALNDTGPHQRWSTGGLYDNITIDGDEINIRNRGYFGTGHGWTAGNSVVWNSTANGFIIENPPTAQNWLIGSVGAVRSDNRFGPQPPGIVDQHGTHVDTRSLYEAQVDDRDRFEDASFREYHEGDYDGYVIDGPGSRDTAYVDATWELEVASFASDLSLGLQSFDDTAATGLVPFSFAFDLAPDERVAAATLTVALREASSSTLNPFLAIERLEHAQPLTALGLPASLSSTASEILVFPLSATHVAGLQDGLLNAVVGAGLAVDWARLDLVVVPGLLGDFNNDALIDDTDIDLLGLAIREASTDPVYELDGSLGLDAGDIAVMLELAGTLPGDANLDGTVDLIDLSLLASNFQSLGGWALGDANLDGTVNLVDLSLLATNFGQSFSVPEPTAALLVLLGLTARLR
ncbi:hypothetical protein [Mucisphaera sp.]|uniref:hypothetical protein n=1 Tax=Mucisphaera sp. TaxID=2913024 RepID=UPI003D145A1E